MFKNNRGVALITAYGVMAVLIILLGVYCVRSVNESNLAERHRRSAQAFYVAEAGIQKALWVISNNPAQTNDWLTTEANKDNNLGNGSFQVQITGDSTTKNITSSGTVSAIVRRIQVQAENSWLSKISAAIYSKGVDKIKFKKRDEYAYIDGKSKPGIYCTDYVSTKEGEGLIKGTPPILENQQVPEALQDGIWHAFDINGLRKIAQANGTYFSADESYDEYNNPYNKKGKYTLPLELDDGTKISDGVFFFDAKNGEPLNDDLEPSNIIKVKLEGTTEGVSGIIVVVGDLDIKDTKDYDFLFDGVILVLNDLTIVDKNTHRRLGTNDSDVYIKGAILCDNVIEKGKGRKKKPCINITDATIEYDANSITSGYSNWSVVPGSWQEL